MSSGARVLPAKVETVLFDAGGVLLDLDFSYLRRLIEARGLEVSEAALARAEAKSRVEFNRSARVDAESHDIWRDYFHLVLGEVRVPGPEHDALIETLWEAHQRVGLWTVAAPGAPEVVREMRERGHRVGVISNAEGQVARDLDLAGFDGLLDAVIDSHVVGVRKPDPEIFRIALAELGVPAETAVFVGDVPVVDVAGARSAGIAPILLDPHDLHARTEAVPTLRSLKELPALLAEV
jgi:putative hydrolase of the HAD superfamily